MRKRAVEVGRVFGRLTVLKLTDEMGKWGDRKVECACSCGQTVVVLTSQLRKGHTKSCGCLRRELVRSLGYSNRKYEVACGCSKLYRKYVQRAARCKLEFSLSREKFAEITSSCCAYCGRKPSLIITDSSKSTQFNYVYSSVDRVDSSKGYAENNVVSACKHCQIAKNSYSVEEFKNWVKAAYAKMWETA